MKADIGRLDRRWPRAIALALVASIASWWVAAPAAPASSGGAKVTVVHAVPGLKVDVYVNDSLFLEDFKPSTIVGPVGLAAGAYDIEITPANSSAVALSSTANLTHGDDLSLVAHLDEAGTPSLSAFDNRKAAVQPPRAGITVRHVAAAPAVDVRVKRPSNKSWTTIVPGLENGAEATGALRLGRTLADVVPAGTSQRVIGPARVPLKPHKHTFVYAWGSATAGFGFLIQTR